jgi:hypothetical protein
MGIRVKFSVFLLFVCTLLISASTAAVAADKQVFKDEAGEVLYTIDENGIVSMFENSPGTDVTLSVTRGTHEQMQPQITEVTPNAVAAGTYTVLKLEGKNLVGAKVKLSAPAIEVGAYAGKPKRLDVPITVPLSQPLGEVTIEATTPIGSTTAKFTVTDVQIGGGGSPTVKDVITHPGMVYGADEGSGPIPTTAPSTCPKGMLPLSGEMGGFCIEIDRSFKGDFRLAELHCAMVGRRLCMVNEWKRACEEAVAGKVPLKNIKGDWEWTAGFEVVLDDTQQDTAYFLYGKADCETQHKTMRINAEKFVGRCCRNP